MGGRGELPLEIRNNNESGSGHLSVSFSCQAFQAAGYLDWDLLGTLDENDLEVSTPWVWMACGFGTGWSVWNEC